MELFEFEFFCMLVMFTILTRYSDNKHYIYCTLVYYQNKVQ